MRGNYSVNFILPLIIDFKNCAGKNTSLLILVDPGPEGTAQQRPVSAVCIQLRLLDF